MDVRARILNHTLFGAAKFHYIQKNKFLKIENNFQKFKKNSRVIALILNGTSFLRIEKKLKKFDFTNFPIL